MVCILSEEGGGNAQIHRDAQQVLQHGGDRSAGERRIDAQAVQGERQQCGDQRSDTGGGQERDRDDQRDLTVAPEDIQTQPRDGADRSSDQQSQKAFAPQMQEHGDPAVGQGPNQDRLCLGADRIRHIDDEREKEGQRDLLLQGKTVELYNAVKDGSYFGCVTFNQSLKRLKSLLEKA